MSFRDETEIVDKYVRDTHTTSSVNDDEQLKSDYRVTCNFREQTSANTQSDENMAENEEIRLSIQMNEEIIKSLQDEVLTSIVSQFWHNELAYRRNTSLPPRATRFKTAKENGAS